MEPFKVHILGCGSALPTPRHNASSQIVEIRGKMIMVDCGEGTQMQLRRMHVRFTQIAAVLISHLHGDHCFGLIGMISSFGMLGRNTPLHIYAPGEFEPILNSLMTMFCGGLNFEVVFHAVDTAANEVICETKGFTIETIPLKHRIPCCGFLFRERQSLPHIRRDMIDFYGIPLSQVNNIKNGADGVAADGGIIVNDRLTKPAGQPRAYAYCSDTKYLPNLYKSLTGVNTLYHESTYANDCEGNAKKYFHSTAAQAARVARAASVDKLVLGHYSARYKDENILLDDAKSIFPNSFLSKEGLVFDV